MPYVGSSLVEKSGEVAKDKGADWDVGHDNVVVDAKVLGPEQVRSRGDSKRRDGAGADAYGGGGNVEDELGGVDEEEEGCCHWSH